MDKEAISQEDEPHSYEVMGYKPRSKNAFVCATFPCIESATKYAAELKHSNVRPLYTRPSSELRKAAEQVVSRFDRYMLEESRLPDLITAIENLRSALERK
jgi:hypothetical protein